MGLFDSILGKNVADKPLSDADCEKLMGAVSTMSDRLIVALPMTCGIALEEFIGLQRGDVDRLSRTIIVYNAQTKKQRRVFLPKETMQMLTEYIDKTNMDGANSGSKPILTFSRNTIMNRLEEQTKKAFGYRVSWYALRRTYVRRSAAHNIPPKLVADNMGIDVGKIIEHFDLTPDEKRKLMG